MCSSFLPVRFLYSNLLSTPFKMHYTKHHYFSTTFLLLHLLHCGCSITKMEGHVGLHTPMQRQLRAYPYAYTLLPLYYISTSLSHWLSWPLGSNRLWASVARTFKGRRLGVVLVVLDPPRPPSSKDPAFPASRRRRSDLRIPHQLSQSRLPAVHDVRLPCQPSAIFVNHRVAAASRSFRSSPATTTQGIKHTPLRC